MIDLRRRWGQWRVYYLTEQGDTAFLPASWTDALAEDPFVERAQGRAIARVQDLLELAKIAQGSVKQMKPNV